ncbi:hypothetical protein [Mucilaginibacter conchicola]|nr:hypothetical protein [Mucilaginibacter conchicola]
MKKFLTALLLTAISLGACKKNSNKGGCDTQMCTNEFVSVTMRFTNKDGSPVTISGVTVINMRTNKPVELPKYSPSIDYVAGTVLVADDGTKNQFSTGGDDIKITAKSDATGQVKSVMYKISGGCNCHVNKISGDLTVAFD